MGYFTQQIYNQPQSMYVDPRLDILQQSAATIQGRHDKAVSEMNAYDILAANLQVAEGDQAYKDQKVAELAAQSKAIADRGDYAMAQPRINQAAKGFLADQNLIAMQENRKAIDQYNNRVQELGASALDFNPAANWSTIGEDGKAKRFVAHVEQRKDWDKRAQEVTRLIADQMPIELKSAGVDAYLMSGSISGISDEKVRNYLGQSISRFTATEEGDQMKRKLMKIDGMDEATADMEIARFVHSVGQAQVHEKRDHNYQVNAPVMQQRSQNHAMVMQKNSQTFQKEMQEDQQAFQLEVEKERYKKELDKVNAANAKRNGAGSSDAPTLSPSVNVLQGASKHNADGSYGTTITNELAPKLGLIPTQIETPTGLKYPGFIAQNGILTFGNKITPKSGNFAATEVKKASEIFSIRDSLKELERISGEWKAFDVIGNMQKSGATPEQREQYKLEKARLETELAKYSKEDIEMAEKYVSVLGDDKTKLAQSIGMKFQNANIPAVVAQNGRPNNYMVDGKLMLDATAELSGSQLTSMFTNEEIAYLHESGVLKGNHTRILFGTNLTDGVNDSEMYKLNFSTVVNPDPNVLDQFDRTLLGDKNHGDLSFELKQTQNQFFEESMIRTVAAEELKTPEYRGQVKTKLDVAFTEIYNKLNNDIDAGVFDGNAANPEEILKKRKELENQVQSNYAADKQDIEKYKGWLDKYDTLTDIKKEELVKYLIDLQKKSQ